MWRDNQILNSQVLLGQLRMDTEVPVMEESTVSTIEIEQVAKENSMQKSPLVFNADAGEIPGSIEGSWQGRLVEMEWSGKHIVRSLPIHLSVGGSESGFGSVAVSLVTDTEKASGQAIWTNGTLTFLDLTIPINKQYTDHPDFPDLDHEFLSASFTKTNWRDNTYLLGRLETHIPEWSEPGPPMLMVLTRDGSDLSDEILEAFARQGNSFIKLYPNRFTDQLLVHYELKADAQVGVSLYDYYGRTAARNFSQGFQKAGEQTLHLYDLPVRPGLYVVRITVNGKEHTKLVVKK